MGYIFCLFQAFSHILVVSLQAYKKELYDCFKQVHYIQVAALNLGCLIFSYNLCFMFPKRALAFMCLQYNSFENTVGK